MTPSQPEPGCDGLGGCRLHFLAPEVLPALEEVRDVPGEQQMEFRQILKQTGEGHSKSSPSQARNLLNCLQTVEASVAVMASRLERLQEENKLNLSHVEERLDSLVVLLMGILSGCKLPCNDSVLKTFILERRCLKTLEIKEETHLVLKGMRQVGAQDLGRAHKAEKTSALLVEASKKLDQSFPQDCTEIHKQGIHENSIYTIQPIPLRQPFEAYCDMVMDWGSWTMFQRWQDGSLDFSCTWQEYRLGFGSLQGKHWLGNEQLHGLMRLAQHTLRVGLEDWYGVQHHTIYLKFKIASEANKYRLTAQEYQGNAGNALTYTHHYNHDHKCFTTWDSDNYPMGNCNYRASWWFDSCLAADLNGKYHQGQ